MNRMFTKCLALIVLTGWSIAAIAQPAVWETDFGSDLGLGDDSTADVALADFTFPFQGTTYTGADIINVSSNGFISINGDNGSDCCAGNPAGLVGDTFGRIAVFWADLNPSSAGGVFVNTFDDDMNMVTDRLVVTWDTVLFDNDGPISVQAQLFADGTIILGYNGFLLAGFNDDTLIGVSPGGGVADPGSTDLTASVPFDSGAEGTVYEFWIGAPPAVDVDQTNIVFTPNGTGGWDVDDNAPLPPPAPGATTAISTLNGPGLAILLLLMLFVGSAAMRSRLS